LPGDKVHPSGLTLSQAREVDRRREEELEKKCKQGEETMAKMNRELKLEQKRELEQDLEWLLGKEMEPELKRKRELELRRELERLGGDDGVEEAAPVEKPRPVTMYQNVILTQAMIDQAKKLGLPDDYIRVKFFEYVEFNQKNGISLWDEKRHALMWGGYCKRAVLFANNRARRGV
jgi:hypothetical protein